MAREPWTLPGWTEPRWTPRQANVLEQIGKGSTNPEIATELSISLAGAKWHVSEVLSKLGVLSRQDAAAYWRWRTSRRTRARRWARGVAALAMGKAGAVVLAAGFMTVVAVGAIVILTQDDRSAEAASAAETPDATSTQQFKSNAATATPEPTEAPATPTTTVVISAIDWVDVFQFGGITYLRGGMMGTWPLVDQADLGSKFAEVEFNISRNVTDSSYLIKDGDATFLVEGTPVYEVRGYSPGFRLAALVDGQFFLYEVNSNAAATQGSDMLDIGGKVDYIGIYGDWDFRIEVAAIKDPEEVAALVEMVLTAPLDAEDHTNLERPHLLAFHLSDGTRVIRAYWIGSGELSRGIMLPPEFGEAIERVLADSQ